jgi:hypothetical protein
MSFILSSISRIARSYLYDVSFPFAGPTGNRAAVVAIPVAEALFSPALSVQTRLSQV